MPWFSRGKTPDPALALDRAPMYPYPEDPSMVRHALAVNIFWFSGEGMKTLRRWVEQHGPGRWKDDHNLLILTEIEFLLLFMLDARAFQTLGAIGRDRLMDFMVPTVLGATIDAMIRPPAGGKKAEIAKTLNRIKASNLVDYNGRLTSFAALKNVTPAPGESPTGTLLWEFSDYLAQHFGYRNDAAVIAEVQQVLLKVIGQLELPEAIAKLKDGN